MAATAVFVVTPWILGELLDNRYSFTPALLVAFVVVGFVRLWDGIAQSRRDNSRLSPRLARAECLRGWAALGIGILGAVLLAEAELTGITYGVGAGWLACARLHDAREASQGNPRIVVYGVGTAYSR